jgi:hypothetical protein
MTGHEIRVEVRTAAQGILTEWDNYSLVSSRANANSEAIERLRKALAALDKHEASLP